MSDELLPTSTSGGYKEMVVQVDDDRWSARRSLFVKAHTTAESTSSARPVDRTAVVLGVPPFCNRVALQQLFAEFGAVEQVFLQSRLGGASEQVADTGGYFASSTRSIQGYQVAYVVFEAKAAIGRLVSSDLQRDGRLLASADNPPMSGLSKWCAEYADGIADTDRLQLEVDTFMQAFDAENDKAERRKKKRLSEPDAEGWVTVGVKPREASLTSAVFKRQPKSAVPRQKRRKEKQEVSENFYKFQMRDSKLKRLEELRAKFDDDKKRIALMRAARKFRPG